MEFTPRSLTQRCIDLELATSQQIDRLWGELRTDQVSLDEIKTLLLRKGLLTNFQLDRMLTGERLGYFYGPYKVLYMIGAGTFARVFRAVHRDTGKVVAIKVLRRRHRDQLAQIEQFLREGRMGLELRHPNIVTIYEIVNDPRAPYLVMEFVEGETLREILKIRGKFDALDGLRVIQDVCAGLDFAFQRGITHRDMKLSNVLVHSSGRCKLVDFGLAALADVSSPEAIADCPSAVAPGLPDFVYAICNKAMEFQPDKRYQTPGQMLADVEAAIKRIQNPESAVPVAVGGSTDVEHIDPEEQMEGQGKTVMIIESKAELQDLLREKLKKRGYRVLVFSDPERALARFSPEETIPADCVVLCAVDLGNHALEAFNTLVQQEHTKNIPVIMLVDPKQQHIIRGANTSAHHVLLPMPLKVRELRQALVQLTRKPADPVAS
ncbi:MAG: serine/threonine-protein kinase [Pirellula sp.]|nr:serine/threonine-protein kinase [Pirellula sp.]